MRKVLALSLLLMSCRASPVEDITKRGGKHPIACVSYVKGYGPGVVTCRDGGGIIWACGVAGDVYDCIPVTVLVQQWSVPTPAAEVPHVPN